MSSVYANKREIDVSRSKYNNAPKIIKIFETNIEL